MPTKVHHPKLPMQLPPLPDLFTTYGNHLIAGMAFDKSIQLTIVHNWPYFVLRRLKHRKERDYPLNRTIPSLQPTLGNPSFQLGAIALMHHGRLRALIL